jgi:hypothetical protein
MLQSVIAFHQRASALLSASDVLRERARYEIGILVERQALETLGTLPIAELRMVAGRGARLGALADAGYRTVADVLQAGAFRLQAVPGIGLQSANQVSTAAQTLAAQVRAEARIRFDPDRQDPAQTQLLATLAAIRHADSVRASLQGTLHQLAAQVAPLVDRAGATTSRIRMFFSGAERKRSALTALAELRSIFADPRVVALQQAVAWQEQRAASHVESPVQLWQAYAAEAATFNALLSTLGAQAEADTSEAAQGFVPDELRQAISAVPLDTSLLTATLRGYQVFGAQYAIHQQRSILGDEMGLGKTVQALATMTHMAARGQKRFLVVCPASVQANWINEIGKHTLLDGHSLHGSGRDAATDEWLRAGGVAVTTFGTLGRLPGVASAGIAMMVVDEAHYVKNPDAQRSQTVADIVARAQRVLFLTGTPMENKVEEFRNLVEYLQPHLARGLDATDVLAGAKRFRRAVAPVYLRRNQEDVLTELPDKIEAPEWVEFTAADAAAYREAVISGDMMRMRRAAFFSADSAKLRRLYEIATQASEGSLKVIVFSFFLDVLEIVHRTLGATVLGKITGAVAPAARQQMVDAFTQTPGHGVLLSQIEAGGVGLNVQAASVVIIAEPQWKPSTEEQAIARAYRMGQIRKVQVYRLLAAQSVDERIQEIQQGKRLLFAEFARKSDAKEADRRAVDTNAHRPAALDDATLPPKQRVLLAEQYRLGIHA